MNKTIKTLISALAFTTIMSVTVFASMPQGTVVIGDKAFSLAYANNTSNTEEVTNAVVNSQGKIYIKDFSGNWINNTIGQLIEKELIPQVTYKSENGEVKYSEHDGDEITDNTVIEDKEEELTQSYIEENIKKSYLGKRIKLVDGKVHAEYDKNWYELGTEMTPDIHEKVKKLVKYYLDNNEKEDYVFPSYLYQEQTEDEKKHSEFGLALFEYRGFSNEMFEVVIPDTKSIDYMRNAKVRIEIAHLSDSENMTEGSKNGNFKEAYFFTPYYVERFENTIKILFEDTGHWEEIYDYVMEGWSKYADAETFEDSVAIYMTKTIGNTEIIIDVSSTGKFYVYFKYSTFAHDFLGVSL